ncbi:hypothetical protein HPB48_014125 [Haemaphysalis longicornis]|uniref:Uncharacterized protein n=1 Tax=Haemaphysalis longicornis TaxID=44386 RepID=A0A9J6FJA5_HAELO|nr:hypothetical protein HPB48_014125 [Haemaphysalis longicornis]
MYFLQTYKNLLESVLFKLWDEVEPASQKVDASLAALTRMAHNPECLDSILAGLQRHLAAIIELTLLVDGDRLQRPLAALFNRLLLEEWPATSGVRSLEVAAMMVLLGRIVAERRQGRWPASRFLRLATATP